MNTIRYTTSLFLLLAGILKAAPPLRFERHQEAGGPSGFVARGPGYAALLTPAGAEVRVGDGSFRLELERANLAARWEAQRPLPGKSHYFMGNDPRQWQLGVTGFGRVCLRGVYTGIDLAYYGNRQQLEMDLEVAPGADPSRAVFRIPTAQRLEVDAAGDLVIHLSKTTVRFHRPVAYQRTQSERIPVRWRLVGPKRAGFRLGKWDRSRPLVIDPVMSYSTYLGGASVDIATGIAVDGLRNSYITGVTSSFNFPLAVAAQNGSRGSRDIFISKLSANGDVLLYSTYLGGNSDDGATAIAVDPQGNAYITGWTSSSNFPVFNPAQKALAGTRTGTIAPSDIGACRFSCDAFVVKLNPQGLLLYSTFLGGAVNDMGTGIAVDSAGRAYVAGWTSSADFPTARAVQPQLSGALDAFVARLSASGGAIEFASFLGGSLADWANGIAVDGSQGVYLTGRTNSTDFPLTAALQAKPGGGGDAFVTKLDLSTFKTVYSTYLGGGGTDSGNGIAVAANGSATVTGETLSTDFPATPGAFQAKSTKSAWARSSDAGGAWKTTAAGLANVSIFDIAIDPSSAAVIYAATSGGIFKSADGGETWNAAIGLPAGATNCVIVDPVSPSTVYACTTGSVFKSTDGGQSWASAKAGLPNAAVEALALDPSQTSTLYAGTEAGLFISSNAADSWRSTAVDRFYDVKSIAVDPVNPALVYATVSEFDYIFGDFLQDSVLRSEDAGRTWNDAVNNGIRGTGTTHIIVDVNHPGTLFLGTGIGVFRSVDGAGTWQQVSGIDDQTWALAVAPAQDRAAPSTVYAGTGSGLFKSADGGDTWTPINNGLAMRFINALAVNAANPSVVFAGGDLGSAAFVARLSASGAALEYATYLGSDGDDVGLAVAVDASGSATVVGRTDSGAFPTASPLQAMPRAGTDAFVARIKGDGSGLSFGTYLGGTRYDEARAVALDSASQIYVAGYSSSVDFPLTVPLQPNAGDRGQFGDTFVAKIVINEGDPNAPPLPAPRAVAPVNNAGVAQNDPKSGCPADAQRGAGSLIHFQWTAPDPARVRGYELVARHRGATIPILDTILQRVTSYDYSSCGFVADPNLDGWEWRVRALAEVGPDSDWSDIATFRFLPCRLADGRACFAP